MSGVVSKRNARGSVGDIGDRTTWTPPDMRSVIFDDQGEVWDAKSRRLAHDLNASIEGEELIDYAIRNLGLRGGQGYERLAAHLAAALGRLADRFQRTDVLAARPHRPTAF